MTPSPNVFTILTVCTGNICRSPLAEAALRSGLSDLDGVVVTSAGTSAPDGAAVPPDFIEQARALGLSTASHRAQTLTPELLRTADLVLALDRGHRREIVTLLPRANRTTVTLREFARLASAVPDDELAADREATGPALGDRLRSCVATLLSYRGLVDPPAVPADDDIADPYRRGQAAAERASVEIVDAVDRVCGALRRSAA